MKLDLTMLDWSHTKLDLNFAKLNASHVMSDLKHARPFKIDLKVQVEDLLKLYGVWFSF